MSLAAKHILDDLHIEKTDIVYRNDPYSMVLDWLIWN